MTPEQFKDGLDEQFRWMVSAIDFIKSVEPERARNLKARLELQIMDKRTDAPRRVTEMVLAELEEMVKKTVRDESHCQCRSGSPDTCPKCTDMETGEKYSDEDKLE